MATAQHQQLAFCSMKRVDDEMLFGNGTKTGQVSQVNDHKYNDNENI
jgi:hypothetical protein